MPGGSGPPARRPRCEPSARRVGSKPGQALPPPSGTAVGACCMVATPPAPASFPPLRPCWQSVWLYTYKIAGTKRSRRFTVGVAGFEPTASSSRTKRATKLRHTPVPFEYSLTPSIFPNGDGVSARSVDHAACCQAASSRRKPSRRRWCRLPMRGTRAAGIPRDASRCEPLRRGRSPGQLRHAATPQRRQEPPSASSPSRTGAKYRSS